MSNHSPKVKVDAGSWIMFLASAVAILAAVYVLVMSLVNTIQKNSTKGEIDSTQLVSNVSDNLKPIGISSTSDSAATAAPAATAARSGKEVYDAVCKACHATGVADAPKFGDKAAWEPRVATGLDALMATAINGKGAMPARAGQNIGDAELKATILYMTKEAGFDLGGGAAAPKAAEPKKEEVKAEEPKKEEAVKKETETKTEKVADEPTAPEKPAAPAAPAMAAAATTAAVATTEAAPAAKKAEPEPAKAGGDGAALYIAKGCTACHGADAKTPIMTLYPKIAGQSKTYVTTQMTDIKSGKRSNGQSAAMKGIMASVSETEIAAIADYLSSL